VPRVVRFLIDIEDSFHPRGTDLEIRVSFDRGDGASHGRCECMPPAGA
jgi:hypothetical protein